MDVPMYEPEHSTTPGSPSESLRGVVIAVEATLLRVRLESGEVVAAAPMSKEIAETRIGTQAMFRVLGVTAEGLRTAAFAGEIVPDGVTEPLGPPEEPFDRDVVRLHQALANHHPATVTRGAERVHLGEEEVRSWIGRVDARVERLRKSRARRLNDRFYKS